MKHIDMHQRGAVSEAVAELFFLRNGWEVYLPRLPQSKCDFIIAKGSELKKIQVKTGSWATTNGHSYCQIRLTNRNGNCYSREDFDILVVVDGNDLYIIPHEEIEGRTSLYFKTTNPNPKKSQRDYDPEKWRVSI